MEITATTISRSIKALIILSLSPFIVYYLKFQTYHISNNPTDWGPFGDFIGGILNPILSLINIILLIYITYIVSSIEESRNDKTLKTQTMILLTELRSSLYNETVTELKKLSMSIVEEKKFLSKITEIENQFETFSSNSDHLFSNISNNKNIPLIKLNIKEIRSALKKYNKLVQTQPQDEEAKAKEVEKLKILFKDYKTNTSNLIKEMQQIMMNHVI